MEQLKVRKKGMIVLNCIFYLVLSFFFLYLQYAYRSHVTPFSVLYLQKSIELFWYIVLPLIVSMGLLWKHHRYCSHAFVISTVLIGFKILEGLFIEFNKMIVLSLFFYVVISYFLYQLLNQYLSLAELNSNYSENDLFKPLLTEIHCSLQLNNGEHEYAGVLTNWDSEGCFVRLHEWPAEKMKKASLVIHFGGRDFVEHGEVVAQSTSLKGVGLKLKYSSKDLKVFNWVDFIELVEELGFDPKRLR